MAHTNTWNAANEASPADSDAVSEGAGKIRTLKLDIRERIAKDHYMDIAGTDADHGEHSKITFQAPISKPANVAEKGFLYDKDVDSVVELHYEDESGNEIQISDKGVLNIPMLLTGVMVRPIFTWVSTTAITVSHLLRHHSGTIEQMLFSEAAISFTFGSAGSNANSDDLTASDWHYLYIDDSALSGRQVTAARLINLTAEPVWSAAKGGWESPTDANDICIGAFRTNASSELIDFHHEGGRFVQYDAPLATDIGGLGTGPQDVDTAYLIVTGVLPKFCTQGRFWHAMLGLGADAIYTTARVYGSAGTGMIVNSRGGRYSTYDMYVDSSQRYEVKHSEAGDTTSEIETIGYYFPTGM